jgi:hypothetical protein
MISLLDNSPTGAPLGLGPLSVLDGLGLNLISVPKLRYGLLRFCSRRVFAVRISFVVLFLRKPGGTGCVGGRGPDAFAHRRAEVGAGLTGLVDRFLNNIAIQLMVV